MSTERVEIAGRFTRDEAAGRLTVSTRTIDRYIAQGKLTPVKFHNGHVELYRSEVEALLEPVSS